MRPLGYYIKVSVVAHLCVIAGIGIATLFVKDREVAHMKFVILPKGTSLDAVLTKEVEEAMKKPQLDEALGSRGAPLPMTTPAVTPVPTPQASPTPVKLATPTPVVTPVAPAVPENKVTVAPQGTPKPTATPVPEKPKATVTPKATSTPKSEKKGEAAKETPTTKESAEKSAKPTPKGLKPTPTPKVVASAAKNGDGRKTGEGGGKNLGPLPKQTPSNVKVGEASGNQEVGVPGVAEGVEGAPLPLDRNQSMLSMLYTTRARMRIQTNFTVPPGVNDPEMSCVVEWEILPDGTIKNAKVTKSTGVAAYDSCALDAIQKTASLGPLPPEFGKKSIWTSLTFVYAGDGTE